jgi:hypothetical protein
MLLLSTTSWEDIDKEEPFILSTLIRLLFVIRNESIILNEIFSIYLPSVIVYYYYSVPIAVSQIRTVLSSDADASNFELYKKATNWTELLYPLSVCYSVPIAASQIRTILLLDADASSFESYKKATNKTTLLYSLSVCYSIFVAISQICTISL